MSSDTLLLRHTHSTADNLMPHIWHVLRCGRRPGVVRGHRTATAQHRNAIAHKVAACRVAHGTAAHHIPTLRHNQFSIQ